MRNLLKRVELLTNVAILIVAVLLGVVLVKQHLLSKRIEFVPPASARNELSPVDKVPMAEVEWVKNGYTLLLVLQKGCRFCTESAPFYERLVKETSSRTDVKLVALLPQPVAESKQYLEELGVNIADVRQVSPNQIKVGGTPTLILVNDLGVATYIWRGKLPSEVESQVLSKL